jgi:hypothetical protein
VTSPDPTAHIERLPGVLAATLFLDTPAPPRVYAALAPEADPSALTAAILGLLRDHGHHTAPENVHLGVAPMPVTRAEGSLARATLDSVDVQRKANRAHCTVRLRSTGRVLTGSATEPDSPSGRARAAARALLEAAESLDPDYRFGLEGVRSLDLFGEAAVVVVVDASAGRAHARLAGTALEDRSIEESGALAALQALRSWQP